MSRLLVDTAASAGEYINRQDFRPIQASNSLLLVLMVMTCPEPRCRNVHRHVFIAQFRLLGCSLIEGCSQAKHSANAVISNQLDRQARIESSPRRVRRIIDGEKCSVGRANPRHHANCHLACSNSKYRVITKEHKYPSVEKRAYGVQHEFSVPTRGI